LSQVLCDGLSRASRGGALPEKLSVFLTVNHSILNIRQGGDARLSAKNLGAFMMDTKPNIFNQEKRRR